MNKDPKSSKEQAQLFKNALQYTIELFKGGEEIWPDQCIYAISRLEVVKIIVQDSCHLLDNNVCSMRKVASGQSESDFNITLHYTYKQLSDLQTLVAAFQPVCRSATKHIEKKRAEIRRKLDLFMLNSESIIEDIASLERGRTQRSFRHVSKAHVVTSPSMDKESKYLRYQQQIAADKSDDTLGRKPFPPYLTPVKDTYVEEQDAPQLDLAKKESILSLDDEQERMNDILPFMKNSMRCCSLAPNNTGPCN